MTSNNRQLTSKHAIEIDKPVFKKVRTKHSIRGGDRNDVDPSRGSIFIEQAFSSPLA